MDFCEHPTKTQREAMNQLSRLSDQLDALYLQRERIEQRQVWLRDGLIELVSILTERKRNYEHYEQYRDPSNAWNAFGEPQYHARRWRSKLQQWSRKWDSQFFGSEKYTKPQPGFLGWLSWSLFGPPTPPDYKTVRVSMEIKLDNLKEERAALQARINGLRNERQECNYLLIRRRLSEDERKQIWNRDCRQCYLCGEKIPDWSGEFMHVDHEEAFARGGSNDFSNLRATHPECNLSKGSRPNKRRLT